MESRRTTTQFCHVQRPLWVALLVGLVVMLCCSRGSRATRSSPETTGPPLVLKVRLDRASYFEHEPIYVEWALVNTTDHPLQLFNFSTFQAMAFEALLADGTPCKLRRHAAAVDYSPRTMRIHTIEAHSWLAGWDQFDELYEGIFGTGSFKLIPWCSVVTEYDDSRQFNDQYENLEATPLALAITTPDRANQEALDIINAHYHVNPQERTAHSEYLVGDWIHVDAFLEQPFQSTNSGRYKIARDFGLIALEAENGLSFGRPEAGAPQRFRSRLQAVQSSCDASNFMKGFAALYLIRCDYFANSEKPTELDARASRLEKEHGESYIGFEARQLRAHFEAHGKYDPAKASN